MEERINIPSIKLSSVEKMVESVRKNIGKEDIDLSFEFILTAFFPGCWNNIKDSLGKQYELGYRAGVKDGEESVKFSLEEDADCFCD